MTSPSETQEVCQSDSFRDDVLAGLAEPQKTLPCKYFYDETGSQLFDQICDLEEYYLTRTELQIMEEQIDHMVSEFGDRCLVVEYGSGSSRKSRLILDRLTSKCVYVPVDISREHLELTARELRRTYPHLPIHPVCADFTEPFDLPKKASASGRTIAYFPGSTIGNFPPDAAVELLSGMRDLVGNGGGVLIGVDLPKSPEILEAAYDDRQGVTSRFNMNLLERINRDLDAEIPLHQFEHLACFNETESRVEMHLVSTEEQTICVEGVNIDFATGETIHTENSYKYSLADFEELAAEAGFAVHRVWCDANRFFSIQFLVATEPTP